MTWQELQSSIAFRLNRPDLPAALVLEFLSERVDFYGPMVLVPAEQTNYSIVTQPGQFFYTLPQGTQKITFVRVLDDGIWIPVPVFDRYSDLLASDPSQPPFVSLPVSGYRIYGNQIRLFPTANAQYPVELTGMFTIAMPTDPGDTTNFWVNDGRMLLINATCAELCREYLDIAVPQSPRIKVYDENTARALDMLMAQVHAYTGPSLIKQYL